MVGMIVSIVFNNEIYIENNEGQLSDKEAKKCNFYFAWSIISVVTFFIYGIRCHIESVARSRQREERNAPLRELVGLAKYRVRQVANV